MKQDDLKYCTKCGHLLKSLIIQGKKRIYCHNCDTIYYDNPIPSVAVVTCNEKGQLLLVKRKEEPGKGFWSLPGGFMDDGESAIQAALRELQEETGLQGIVKRFIKIFNQNSDTYGHVIIITYEVGIIGGQLKAGDDAENACFFDIEDLPLLAFSFQKQAIEQVIGCSLPEAGTV
ncbi:MAG TPA: NUDIX hydrolase [Atribacterota bacterium]|nr:NUDIX hydrolase [Atribacterota bacterium]